MTDHPDVTGADPDAFYGAGPTKVKVRLGGTLYTYAVDGDVAPGDTVAVPPPDWNPGGGEQEVAVAAVGSDYDGPLTTARVVRKAGA